MSWSKFDTAPPDKPEVWLIADCLKIDPDAVVGKLLRVWAWFDDHSVDGNAPSVTKKLLDRAVGVEGFCDAMLSAGWMTDDGELISLSNFDRHNGKTAKDRALTAIRVANHKGKGNGAGNAQGVSGALPREEKSKNKKKEPLSHPHGSFRLPLDWQPDVNHLDLYAKHAGVSLHEITPEAITEFTGYWNANGALKPDAEWCQKLVATVKNNRGKSHGQPANTGNGQHSGSGARPSIIERGDQLSREFLQS